MVRALRLTMDSVVAKLKDLSAVDPVDISILELIEDKFGGVAPVGELNALLIVGEFAPRWKEMVVLPSIQQFLPEDLVRAVSTGLAEKELEMRFTKLESLGLIERIPGEDKGKIILTDLGKVIASSRGIPLSMEFRVLRAVMDRLKMPIPPQDRYYLAPGEKVVVTTREVVEVRSGTIGIVVPSPRLSMFGASLANNVVEGPYSDILELVVIGGYAPLILERGVEIGFLIEF